MGMSHYIFRTDWREEFKFWNSPISSFRQEIKGFYQRSRKFKKELKIRFSELFSGGLGRCSRIKAKFELKENIWPVFKKKKCTICIVKADQWRAWQTRKNVLFWGIFFFFLSKVDYSDWASPTVQGAYDSFPDFFRLGTFIDSTLMKL